MDTLFTIHKVTAEEAAHISANPDEAHIHDFEELLIGVEGALEHFIDFSTQVTSAPFVSFISKGKIHRLIPRPVNEKCSVWVVRFKTEFIPESAFQLYTLYHNKSDSAFEGGFCFQRLETLCELMYAETKQEQVNFAIIRQLLSALLSMIEAERKKTKNSKNKLFHSHQISFKNFLLILEDNFRRPLGVDFYAEKLFMSSRNLNLICQNILEQSVSEIIETRKLIEAKNLLISSNKTIAEIAYELGYSDHAYFSNVFKKKAGQTAGVFRKEMRKMLVS